MIGSGLHGGYRADGATGWGCYCHYDRRGIGELSDFHAAQSAKRKPASTEEELLLRSSLFFPLISGRLTVAGTFECEDTHAVTEPSLSKCQMWFNQRK